MPITTLTSPKENLNTMGIQNSNSIIKIKGDMSQNILPSNITNAYNNVMGIDSQYKSTPSYKAGGGGGEAIEGLAKMMGGSIPNPYQFAKMKSSGIASGQAEIEKQTNMLKFQEDKKKREEEDQRYARSMGYSNIESFYRDQEAKRKKQNLNSNY